jgi:hypothetical protein
MWSLNLPGLVLNDNRGTASPQPTVLRNQFTTLWPFGYPAFSIIEREALRFSTISLVTSNSFSFFWLGKLNIRSSINSSRIMRKPASPHFAGHSLAGDRAQRFVAELQTHILKLEQAADTA